MRGKEVAGDDEVTRERSPRHSDPVGELFSSEEMQAIREQYEERVRVADERREELEWQVRLALARIRDAELGARRSADEMARVHQTLAALVGEAEPKIASPPPAPRPPPLPPAPSSNGSSSRAPTPLRPGYKRLVA